MKTQMMAMDNEGLTARLNDAKDMLLEKLREDGVLSEDNFKKASEEYLFVVKSKGNWGRILEKIFPCPENQSAMVLLRRK